MRRDSTDVHPVFAAMARIPAMSPSHSAIACSRKRQLLKKRAMRGINIVGYCGDPSGIGEASRIDGAVCVAGGVPHQHNQYRDDAAG